jgi:ankyrin repeat protein
MLKMGEETQIDSAHKTVTLPQDISIDLNVLGNDNFSPLHVACSVGNEGMVHYLVYKKHADPNIQGR